MNYLEFRKLKISKFLRWLPRVLVGIIVFAAPAAFLLTRSPASNQDQPDLCRTSMQSIDRSSLSQKEIPPQSFSLKDSKGNSHEVKITSSLSREKDGSFKLVKDAPPQITYRLELSPELILDDSQGGYVTVKVKSTGEELLMFKYPQGVDAKNHRVDFSLRLEGNVISLAPHRDWQLSCNLQYPISVYSQITPVTWDEALVMVGDNCDGPACLKDGDVITVKPAGWNWGTEERKVYALVKIPKSKEATRADYSSRTVNPQSPQTLPDHLRPKLFETPDLARYAIDYTALATASQLKDIRNPKKGSPVLDATQKPDAIKKKPDPRLSIVPRTRHLAFAAAEKLKAQTSFWDDIVPSAKAAGVITRSIGTAPGRSYSTLAAWESAEDGDLVTATEVHVGEMYKDSEFDLTAQVTINDSTTNSSYYMHLTSAPGDRHRGTAGTGVVVDCQRSGINGIRLKDNYTRVEWLEAKNCTGANGASAIIIADGSDNSLVQNVIVHSFQDANFSTQGIIFYSDSGLGSAGNTIRNCIVYDGGDAGIRGDSNSGSTNGITATIENCTIYNVPRGIDEDSDSPATCGTDTIFTIKNTIAMNTSATDFLPGSLGWCGTITYSISEDATADDTGGTNTQINKSASAQFVNTTSGREDFHLKSGSDAINAGVTVSGFASDIDQDSRPVGHAWDIGADEFNDQNPVSYWNFDENQGSTANDYSATANNDLTITNAAWKAEDLCVTGSCLSFDGNGDYATKTYSADTEFTAATRSATLSSWFKHTSTAGADILASRTDAVNGVGWKVYMNSGGNMCFGIDAVAGSFPNDSACSGSTYADSKWHHVAAVISGTPAISLTIYVDGLQVGTATSSINTPLDGTNAPFTVGNDFDNGTNGWDGFIDEVKYYAFAKSAAQVRAEFASRGATKGTSAQFGDPEQQNYLSNGLVGYWKMDENTGTTTSDSSGNNNTSSAFTGNVAWVGGKFGPGLDFDGVDDVVRVVESPSTDLGATTDSYTVSVWVNTDNLTGAAQIVSKQATTTYPIRFIISSIERPSFELGHGGTRTTAASSTTLTTGIWYHLVGVRDVASDRAYLYINGSLDTSVSDVTTASVANNDDLSFGNGDTSYLSADFSGSLDEIRIYNRALTPSEISALYNWAPSPVGWWKLDENTGTSAFDTSGNDSAGTLTNGPVWVPGKYGSAVSFDGTNDVITAGSATVLDNLPQMTVSAWYYPKATPVDSERVVGKTADGGQTAGWRWLYTSSSRFNLTIDWGATDLSAQTNAFTALNRWYHVAAVWDGTNVGADIRLYVDGVLQTLNSSTNGSDSRVDDNLSTVAIGARVDGTQGLEALIDDVRIYNYARTAKQIVEDMNAGHPAGGSPISSQMIYWNFDEQQGSTANNSGIDGSLDGTATGTSWLLPQNCKVNGCIDINTTTDDITKSDPAFFDGSGGLTASFWLNPQTLATTRAIASKSNTSQETFLIQTDATNSDELRVYIASSLTDTSNYYTTNNLDLVNNTWAHLAVVYDASESASLRVKVYKNGRLATGSVTGTLPDGGLSASSANFQVGESHKATAGLLSYIDELKIYNYPLSPSDVLIDFAAGGNAAVGPVTNPNDFTNGLVAYYKLDTGSGLSATDSSGNGNTGTLTGGPTWPAGRFSYGVGHDGTDDYITAIDSTSLDTTSVTAAMWFTSTATLDCDGNDNWRSLIRKGSASSTTDGWDVVLEQDRNVQFDVGIGGSTYRSGSINVGMTTNVPIHLVFTYDSASGRQRVYGNGTLLDDQVAVAGGLTTNNSPLDMARGTNAVACPNTSGYTPGVFDEVRIYNRALTGSEVEGLYSWSPGPVGEWKLDENTGTGTDVITDTSGSLNHGDTTSVREDDWIQGKHGSALYFNGSSYVTTNDSTFLNGLGSVAVMAWVNTGSSGSTRLVVSKNDSSSEFVQLDITSVGVANFRMATGGTPSVTWVAGDVTVADNKWHHIAGVYNGSNMYLYVDGVLDNSGAKTGTISTSATSLVFGSRTAGDLRYTGNLDEVRIYNYALTQAEIAQEYNRGAPQSHWAFDECQGTTEYDSAPKADLRATGVNGTITPGAGTNTAAGTCDSGNSAHMWYDGATGKNNASLGFDNTDDYVTMGDNYDFTDGQDFTLSAWIKHAATGSQDTIIAKRNGTASTDVGYLMRIRSGAEDLSFEVSDVTSNDTYLMDGKTAITDTNWHHVVAVFDRDNAVFTTLYVDGRDDKENVSGTITNINDLGNALNLTVGAESDAGDPFNGQIDDVKIFNYALTPSQVKLLYNEDGAMRVGPATGSP